ncbi:hypothetical protein AAFF_G00411040 [Aldrovandia affinis]|uniref:Uncharacterized protein n=1 Tax=Aldrovandia affinis TaxID=143900 RepID=A0AAD7SB64_9TELE|nr:hypothetical protein AAFF_G00411040 [Aldrovandia affinis]
MLISRQSKSAQPFSTNSRGDSWSPMVTGQEEEHKTAYLSPPRPKSTVTFSTQARNRRARESKSQVLSIMQLRQMATIDSISEKELTSQQEHVRQEKEKLKILLRQKLSQKIKTFLRKLDVPETRLDN